MRIFGGLVGKKRIRVRQVYIRALYDAPSYSGETYAISQEGSEMYRKGRGESYFRIFRTCEKGESFNAPAFGCIAFGYRPLQAYINEDCLIFVQEYVK